MKWLRRILFGGEKQPTTPKNPHHTPERMDEVLTIHNDQLDFLKSRVRLLKIRTDDVLHTDDKGQLGDPGGTGPDRNDYNPD